MLSLSFSTLVYIQASENVKIRHFLSDDSTPDCVYVVFVPKCKNTAILFLVHSRGCTTFLVHT